MRFYLIMLIGVVGLSINPEMSFASSTPSKCISVGKIEKIKSEYFECTKSGRQLKLKKVSLSKWQKNLYASTKLTKLPDNLVEPIENAAGWTSNPFKRQINWSSDEGNSPMSDGVPIQNGDGVKVLLMGDSLGAAIGPTFIQMQKMFNWNLRVIFSSSCHVADTKISWNSKEEIEKCDIARTDRIRVINDFKPDILVLIEDPLNPVLPDKGETSIQTWQKNLARSLAKLVKLQNMRIVMISRPVGVNKSLQDCLKRNDQLSNECFGSASKDSSLRLAQRIEVEKVGGSFFDLTPNLCMNGICPPFIGNALVYRDHIHFTYRFAEMLGNELKNYFK
jgi:hypothetical protein